MEIEDDDLEIMKLYGLEPMPKLDDIPELKRILTLGVLIRLKEKYEVPFGKKYTLSEIEAFKYKIVYAEKEMQKYILVFGKSLYSYSNCRSGLYQIYLPDLTYTLDHSYCYWSDYDVMKMNEYNIIPLISNKEPFSDKQKKLIIGAVEDRRDSYWQIFLNNKK